jgi:phosphatidate cytidylyltransferase
MLVVAGGLVPTLIGGPIFALLFIFLGAAAYREFLGLAVRVNQCVHRSIAFAGYLAILALGTAALLGGSATVVFAIGSLAVATPLALLIGQPSLPGAFTAWSLVSAGSLYLGFPVYAAIALRSSFGTVEASWLMDVAGRLSIGWQPAPRGLAWALTVILVTWLSDSVAYLAGTTIGQRKLAPSISPNKTIAGAVGGLVAAFAVGIVSFWSFGLGDWWLGLLAGAAIGLFGQLGDLAESILKRQAGVKDSGTMIPGHGGMLDRIDALLFAFPGGFLLAAGLDRLPSQ